MRARLAAAVASLAGVCLFAAGVAGASKAPPTAPTSAVDPCTSYLAIQVGVDGRFNQGAYPDFLCGFQFGSSFNLSYAWPDFPWSSFETLRVDGADYVYGSSGSVLIPPFDSDATTNVSSWQVTPGVRATQTLSIVKGPSTGNPDTAQIAFDITNTDGVDHQVGLRDMIDTMLNDNDGAPFFLPGVGAVTTEMDFTGDAVPPYWQAFYSLESSSQFSSQGTLIGNGATTPDRFVVAAWPRIDSTTYDFTVNPGQAVTSDSAVGVYWNPRTLAPGQTLHLVTLYGLSGFTQDLSPPLALSVTGPASLSTTASGGYSPNPFTVSAITQNLGSGIANGATLSVSLPPGLSLAPGQQATVNVGNLAPGATASASWDVLAGSQPTPTTLDYEVRADATNTSPKVLTRSIAIPAGGANCSVTTPGILNLDRFAAQICRFTNSLTVMSRQQSKLIDLGASFPHVFPQGLGVYTGPPSQLLAQSRVDDAKTAVDVLVEENVKLAADLISEIVTDQITKLFPCAAQGWTSLMKAYQDLAEITSEDLEATRALFNSQGQTTGTTMLEVEAHLANANLAFLKLLVDWTEGMHKLTQGCEDDGTEPPGSFFVIQVGLAAAAAQNDHDDLEAAVHRLDLTPRAGYLTLPNQVPRLPGWTNVIDPKLFKFGPDKDSLDFDNFPSLVPRTGNKIILPPILLPGLSPTTILPGGSLNLGGAGFQPGSDVTALIASTPVRLTDGPAGPDGSFSATVQIPPGTTPGTHEIELFGDAPDGGPRVLAGEITVTGGAKRPALCTETTTGKINGGLTVPDGAACSLGGATVNGGVKVGAGAVFSADGSTINGGVTATTPTLLVLKNVTVNGPVDGGDGALVQITGSTINGGVAATAPKAFVLCGDRVRGTLSVQTPAGAVLVGSADTPGCAPTTISG